MANETLIKKYMDKYEISREDALEMIAYDEETDKMTMKEINGTLTAEQRKAVKDATKTTSADKKKKTVYKFDKKEKPKDAEKVEIISKIFNFLSENYENCAVLNPVQEISFNIGENDYSIKLTKHRKAKEKG